MRKLLFGTAIAIGALTALGLDACDPGQTEASFCYNVVIAPQGAFSPSVEAKCQAWNIKQAAAYEKEHGQ
jgi:hypothetical protein